MKNLLKIVDRVPICKSNGENSTGYVHVVDRVPIYKKESAEAGPLKVSGNNDLTATNTNPISASSVNDDKSTIRTPSPYYEPSYTSYAPSSLTECPYNNIWMPPTQFDLISCAGMSYKQAQDFNFLRAKSSLSLYSQQVKHDEDLRYEMKKACIHRPAGSSALDNTVAINGSSGNLSFDFDKFNEAFVHSKMLVTIRSFYGRIGKSLFIRNEELNRHVPILEKDLMEEYKYSIPDYCLDTSSGSTLARAFHRMLHKIPPLDKSPYPPLNPHQILFSNGILDLDTEQFIPVTPNTMPFVVFSLPMKYEVDLPVPSVFEALLEDIFDKNEQSIGLAWEIIGAILSNVATLKKIFLFQGRSGAGKTRLSEIIAQLLDESDIYGYNTIADITDSALSKDSQLCKLVYIKEAPDRCISTTQAALLKSFADGGHMRNSAAFKILMGANHPLYTNSDKSLERALINRFLVLPFPKVMDNTDPKVASFESTFLETEKNAIVQKALEAFSAVLKRGHFLCDPPINTCVEDTPDENSFPREGIAAILQDAEVTPPSPQLHKVLTELFEIVENVNPTMTASLIQATIAKVIPSIPKDTPSLGRKLKQVFSNLKSSRSHGVTCYNLSFKKAASLAPADAKSES